MKNIIQSVIDKEKECAARLEKARRDSDASILAVEKRSRDLLENTRSEVSRSAAEMLATAEAQAEQVQKAALADASTSYAAINEEKQTNLAKKALTALLG